ncbi:MAG: toprim domain-containing protein [Anaerolineales bacterium]
MMKEWWCFPIHNPEGEVVADAGRWMDEELPEGVARYLLPPKFSKSLELFNLHRASALGADHVTIVEGCFGAVRLHMLRVSAVALMGTSMSEEQVELLVRAGVQRATLLLDGDDAGRQDCERTLPHLARELFVRVGVLPDEEAPDDCEEAVLREMIETVT